MTMIDERPAGAGVRTELDHTPAQLRRISQLMNDRPMAVLSCLSPDDAYAAQMANMR